MALPRPMGSLEAIRGDGAHGKPLQIAGRTQHLDIQWGEARGRASFIVIVGLESPPCLIGMDIMRPLHVHIDETNGTATPAQPDPQTVHLNAAQSQQQRKEMSLPGATPVPLCQKQKSWSHPRERGDVENLRHHVYMLAPLPGKPDFRKSR